MPISSGTLTFVDHLQTKIKPEMTAEMLEVGTEIELVSSSQNKIRLQSFGLEVITKPIIEIVAH